MTDDRRAELAETLGRLQAAKEDWKWHGQRLHASGYYWEEPKYVVLGGTETHRLAVIAHLLHQPEPTQVLGMRIIHADVREPIVLSEKEYRDAIWTFHVHRQKLRDDEQAMAGAASRR